MFHTSHVSYSKVPYKYQKSIIQSGKYHTMQESIIQYRKVSYNAGWYHTMQDGTIQCRMVPYNAGKYNTSKISYQ
jgi:hypothetical protein